MGKTVNVYGFPNLDPAEDIKTALERYTGIGTIHALEVRKSKGGPRAYAKVQFTTTERADYILELANEKLLWYGSSYLLAREIDHDIEQRPEQFAFDMEDVTLHFGCQISKEILSVLCEMRNASVKFAFGLRNLYFVIPYPTTSYKLQLSYENIRQVQLHRSHGLAASFLVIQLYGAPRVYQKAEDNCLKFYKELPDDQWVRATDFTPSFSIGQSSHLCLELPHDADLPNLASYFPYYAESERPFRLVTGHSFSQNLELVPIVGPTRGSYLPYNIVFKICALVQHGCIPGPVLDASFFELLDPQRRDIASIEYVLEKLFFLKDCCYDPVRWITEEYRKKNRLRSPAISLDAGLVYVRRAQITPSKVYFCGPEVNVSNRVLRRFAEYIDNFLRVSFLDEELGKLNSIDLSPRGESKTAIYRRILSVLRNGIVIGNKKFEFLAFSSSQLRESSAWMFASTGGLNAATIRDWMGDFTSIKNVAKYAARLGQSFSSSKESLSVARHEVERIPDIEVVSSGTKLVFSDGIGKISAEFAKSVSNKCGYDFVPSAFQIRYGGYKGVVAVDPTSSMKLSLRKSMWKFVSYNTKLDILAISKYQPCYMNRQVITLLSTLGIPDHVFQEKQKQAVKLFDAILREPLKAQEALNLMSPGENTNIMKEMLLCGYKPNAEPFLSMMLQAFCATKLFELRTKSRIFVHKGRSMMGCLDETRTLDYGEVFVQCSGAGRRAVCDDHSGTGLNKCKIVHGKVVVAKNPCLHPGDVRVLKAVNVPALHHMVDCVVFPQKGPRPHPNECSGGDLDGDDYFVCWDPDLIPPEQIEPMDYTPAPSMQLDHDVTIEEVEEYFANYIVNDSLGIISNAHTVFADREPKKAMADPCVDLAKRFSIAVDFPKTGVPAEIPARLRVKEYPDFMEKPPDTTTYESQNVIGKLFREVKDIAPTASPVNPFTLEVARRTYDTDMEVDGFMDYVDEAFDFKTKYDYKMGNLMDYYGIKTEAELLSSSIMKMSRSFDRRNDAKVVGLAVKSLRTEARNWFKGGRGARDVVDDDVYAKASAWYHVTYHPSYWGQYNQDMKRNHFLSFPWCVYDKLVEIKKRKAALRKDVESDWLQKQFSAALNLKNVPEQERGDPDEAGPSNRPGKRLRVRGPVATAASYVIWEESCPWLRWDDASDDQKVLWNNRLAKVQNNRVCPPRVMEWSVLTGLGVLERIEELLLVRFIEGDTVFESRAWKKVLSLRDRVIREMSLEMFCSMSVDADWSGVDVMTREVVHFRLGGEMRHCTLPQFGVMTGIFRPSEIELPGFSDYMVRGETHHGSTDGFDADLYWQEITGLEGRFSRTQSKAASIRDPVLRVVHKLLVYSFFHRSTHYDKVHLQELWALWLFQHRDEGRFMNLPWVLACHLEAYGAGSRSDSHICGGHFVTRVMRALEIFTDETLEGCSAPVPMVTITLDDLLASRLIDGSGRLIGLGEAPQPHQPPPAPQAPPVPRPRVDLRSLAAQLTQVKDVQRLLLSRVDALLYDARRYQPLLESLAQERTRVEGTPISAYQPPQILELEPEQVVGAKQVVEEPLVQPAVQKDIGHASGGGDADSDDTSSDDGADDEQVDIKVVDEADVGLVV